MARKEINIFSVSFLDLLSGALAAVIILFIVVPKMDAESKEAKESLKALNLQANQLEGMVKKLEMSVDSSTYKEVIAEMKEIENQLRNSKDNMENLERQYQQAQESFAQAEKQVTKLNNEVNQINDELNQEQTRTAQAKAEARKAIAERDKARMFGVDAEFVLIFTWAENVDVDLHLESVQTGQCCCWQFPNQPFAKHMRAINVGPKDSYEMAYQPQIVPGEYKIRLDLHKGSSALVKGELILYPGTDRQKLIPLSSSALNSNGEKMTLKGRFQITEENIIFYE